MLTLVEMTIITITSIEMGKEMKNKKYLALLIVGIIFLFNSGFVKGFENITKQASGLLSVSGKQQDYTQEELKSWCGKNGIDPDSVQPGDVIRTGTMPPAFSWTEQGQKRQSEIRAAREAERAAQEVARLKKEEEERIAREAERAAQEAARKEAIRKQQEVARKKQEALELLAKEYLTMSESEKYPLLSVNSEPQTILKDVKSGVSAKWLTGFLVANKIEYKTNNDSSLIRAFYPGRKVDFRFYANALYSAEISLTQSVTGDAFVEKYRNAMGAAAKVKKSIGEVERDEEIDLIGALRYSAAEKSDRTVFFGRNITLSVSSDRMVATASYRAIGKAELSDRVVIMLLDSSVSPTKKYDAILLDIKKQITKDKDSAGLDGSNKIDKITVMDKRLYDYRVQKEKEIADEKERKKKEAEKAKNAAALDF